MKFSTPHRRFGPRSRACRMLTPDHERLIERPESRRKLKLRGRPTMWGSPPTNRALSGNRRLDRIHQSASELPKCRLSGGAQRAAIEGSHRACFQARSESRVGAVIAGLSSARAVAPGCMAGYLWPSTARRPLEPRIFPCRLPPASGDPDRHSSRMRLRRQNSWLRPGRSAALALRSPPAGSGSVSSFRP